MQGATRRVRLLTLALFAALLHAQDPAGVIEGTVRDAVTHAPVAGARVVLHGPATASAVTPSGGDFRFERLQPGEYSLTVEKAGYMDSSRGFAAPPARVAPGSPSATANIELTPLGSVEGVVLDEEGKPLSGVHVTVAGLSHTTANDGAFVFEDIEPGSYAVAVNVPHDVRSRTLVRDPASGDFCGYAPALYYPGTGDAQLAIPVVVPPGVRLRNIDLRLRRTPLVELAGRLVEMSGGEALSGGAVALLGPASGVSDPLWRKHATAADGGFRFSLLEPGSYTLAAYRGDSTFAYLLPIEIGKAGVEDRLVPVPPFVHLRGDVKLRDPGQRRRGSLTIFLRGRRSSASIRVDDETSFEFDNVSPGEYTVDVQCQNARLAGAASSGLSVNAVRFGRQDGLRKPITVAEAGNPPLEIQLTADPAGVAGKVVGTTVDGNATFLVTASGAGTAPGMPDLAITKGDFQFASLAPGEYRITAWAYDRSMLGSMLGPAARTCDESVKVTVKDGAVSTVTVRPCP